MQAWALTDLVTGIDEASERRNRIEKAALESEAWYCSLYYGITTSFADFGKW